MSARPASLGPGVTSSITGLVGATVVVRAFGMALEFDAPNWSPPNDIGCTPYHRWTGLWSLARFPQHVLIRHPDRVVVTQTSTDVPNRTVP